MNSTLLYQTYREKHLMLRELPSEVIAFNATFQIQYSPSHTSNVHGSCTIMDFAYCVSLISTFQNLITENYKSLVAWAFFRKNRQALRTCGSAVTQRFIPYCQLWAAFCLPGDSSCLCVICSSNSARHCFGILFHCSAMVEVLGK